MSGLLRRLAGRALGIAPAIRPVIEGSVESGFRANAEVPAIDSAPPFDDRRAPATALPALMADTPAALRVTVNRADVPVPPADASVVPASDPGSSGTSQRPPPLLHDVETPPAPRAVVPTPALTEINLAAGSQVAALPLPPIHRDGGRPAAGEAPPRLLPQQPSGPALDVHPIAALLPAAPSAASRAAREETTEVHVTIGRIEVTAVHEAPPPRREPARRGKAKSLDEYLAARQGRRA